MGKYRVVPLSYDTLNHVSAFTSERSTEGGMVALADNSLRIIRVEKIRRPIHSLIITHKIYTSQAFSTSRNQLPLRS